MTLCVDQLIKNYFSFDLEDNENGDDERKEEIKADAAFCFSTLNGLLYANIFAKKLNTHSPTIVSSTETWKDWQETQDLYSRFLCPQQTLEDNLAT